MKIDSAPDRPSPCPPGTAWVDYSRQQIVLERAEPVTLTWEEIHALMGQYLALSEYRRRARSKTEEMTRA